MAKNEFKLTEEPAEPEQERQKPVRKSKAKPKDARFGKAFRSVLDGSILTRDQVIKLIPFGLYVTFLIIVYIANSYYAEKTIYKTNKLRNELIELEFEYVTSMAETMRLRQPSSISEKLDSMNASIRLPLVPPVKIYVNPSKTDKNKNGGQ